MSKIGYIRVSTGHQNGDLQRDELDKYGCDMIFEDTQSGLTMERGGFKNVMSLAQKDDVIVVWRLDRLGRSLKDLFFVLDALRERGANVHSIKEGIFTDTVGGRLIYNLFSILAEYERELIRDRTIEGLAAARRRGRVGGRPPAVSKEDRDVAMKLIEEGFSPKEISDLLGISKATYYRMVSGEAIHISNKNRKTELAIKKKEKELEALRKKMEL
jgi:DNA invertase Pin-like site-specific DNA recombinase